MRIKNGTVRVGDKILMMSTGAQFEVTETGVFTPGYTPCESLSAGDVGYIAASIKNVSQTRVGDTITQADRPAKEALPGYKEVQPMVFCGIYPADGSAYGNYTGAPGEGI